jgi:hypothetical protein
VSQSRCLSLWSGSHTTNDIASPTWWQKMILHWSLPCAVRSTNLSMPSMQGGCRAAAPCRIRAHHQRLYLEFQTKRSPAEWVEICLLTSLPCELLDLFSGTIPVPSPKTKAFPLLRFAMVFRLLSKNAQEKWVQRIGGCSLDDGRRKSAFAQITTEAFVVGVAIKVTIVIHNLKEHAN